MADTSCEPLNAIDKIPSKSSLVDMTPPTVWDRLLCVAADNLNSRTVLLMRGSPLHDHVALIDVTWRQLYTAVHARASELIRLTGFAPRSLDSPPFVIGLIGQSGYQYLLTMLSLLMMRWTPVLISPQNSVEAVLHLLEVTNTSLLLLENSLHARFAALPQDSCHTVVFPTFTTGDPLQESPNLVEELLHKASLLRAGVDSEKLRNEARAICMYMHTSGSTGHPKAIPWSHEFAVGFICQSKHDYLHGRGHLSYSPLPIYHTGGFSTTLPVMAGYGGITTLVEPYNAVSTISVIQCIKLLREEKPDVFLVPSLLEDIVDSLGMEQALEVLRIPNTILHGGAPLRRDLGDKLISGGARIVTTGGTTEVGIIGSPLFDASRDPRDWPYFKMSCGYEFNFTPVNAEFPNRGYRLIVSSKLMTPSVINHDHPRGFLMPDLWMPHPSRADLWRLVGRLDDIVILSNGEKVNGQQLQDLLCSSPYVSSAIVFGHGKFLCGALVRPSAEYRFVALDHTAERFYLDRLWLYINENVNNVLPRFSRLLRSLVLLESPTKPFRLSDKGTVRNRDTLDLYRREIEQAYHNISDGEPGISSLTVPVPLDIKSIRSFVKSLVSEYIDQDIDDDDDFFASGLDSLLAVKLRFSIISALKAGSKPVKISRDVIYAHPTCSSLSRHISSIMATEIDAARTSVAAELTTRTLIDQVYADLTADLPKQSPVRLHPKTPSSDVYVVTGTTGSLGSAFISILLQQPEQNVKKVYCLNRSSNKGSMIERHRSSYAEKGLDFTILQRGLEDGRAVLIEMDVSKEKLGIRADIYQELLTVVTHIVHIAWPVTFSYQFRSFIPQLVGLRSLIDLALSSLLPNPPQFVFLSSISVAGHLSSSTTNSEATVIPELPVTSVESVLPLGYALSKFTAERILGKASAITPLRVSIVRSGQISGSMVTGAWNRSEYIPSVLRAAVLVGTIPDDLFRQPVRWLPLERASKALYSVSSTLGTSSLTFYGLENVKPVAWDTIVSTFLRLYPCTRPISTSEWLQHVRDLQEHDDSHYSLIDSTLVDYIEYAVFQKTTLTHSTKNVENISLEAAESITFDYDVNGGVLKSYIIYAAEP